MGLEDGMTTLKELEDSLTNIEVLFPRSSHF